MKIVRVQIAPLAPTYHGAGFRVSYGHLTQLDHRMIGLTTEDGTLGVGEIVRLPASDTGPATVLEDDLAPEVEGVDLSDLPQIVDGFRGHGDDARGLCLGLETALYDLIGQQTDMPLSALMGGPARGDVPALLGTSCETPDEISQELRDRAAEFPLIQVKMGLGGIDLDVQRIQAALAALRPDQTLLADFNGARSLAEALTLAERVQDTRLVWEEPCRTISDNLDFARLTGAPVLFDQCVGDLGALQRALTSGLPWGVAVKPFYLGGLTVARTARDMAAAAGMPCRIDGPWSGQVASAASLHLALGMPPDLMLFSGDLTDPLDTPNDLICHAGPARVGPVPGPGLGTADRAQLLAA